MSRERSWRNNSQTPSSRRRGLPGKTLFVNCWLVEASQEDFTRSGIDPERFSISASSTSRIRIADFNQCLEEGLSTKRIHLLGKPVLETISSREVWFSLGNEMVIPEGLGVKIVPYGISASFIPIINNEGHMIVTLRVDRREIVPEENDISGEVTDPKISTQTVQMKRVLEVGEVTALAAPPAQFEELNGELQVYYFSVTRD